MIDQSLHPSTQLSRVELGGLNASAHLDTGCISSVGELVIRTRENNPIYSDRARHANIFFVSLCRLWRTLRSPPSAKHAPPRRRASRKKVDFSAIFLLLPRSPHHTMGRLGMPNANTNTRRDKAQLARKARILARRQGRADEEGGLQGSGSGGDSSE